MEIIELQQDIQDIQEKLVAIVELESQLYQVAQEGRKMYATSWAEAKANVKMASKSRYASSTDSDNFKRIVKQSSASLSQTGKRWILESQMLANKRKTSLREVISKVEEIAIKIQSDAYK